MFDVYNIRIIVDLNHNEYIITLNPNGLIQESSKYKRRLGPYYRINEDDSIIKNKDTCPICLEQYVKGTYKRTLICGHTFHKKCVDKWFKTSPNTCPVCRKYHDPLLINNPKP